MSSKLPLKIEPETTLRGYQRQGIEWLAMLGRYGLNCALCDDMGLGKTIQSLTVILNEAAVYKETTGEHLPSLVICPNTLTYQWKQEINKFFKKYEFNA